MALATLSGAWPAFVRAQRATPSASPSPTLDLLDPAAPETGPVQATASSRISLLVPFPNDPFWASVQTAAQARAIADGITIEVAYLSEPSVPEQLAQLRNAIEQGVDGILLGPVDAAAIAPGIGAANGAGIPVLAVDTAPLGGQVVSIVRTNNVAAARRAGQFIGVELSGQGTVLDIQGDLASPVAQERDQGFRDGLAQYPEISIVFGAGNWQLSGGYNQTAAQLPQPQEGTPSPPAPLVDAVFAAGSLMAQGAAQAVEDVQADTVFVVGFGATNEALRLIRNGLLEATVAEYPTRAGAMAVDLMVRYLNGETIPERVDSGSSLITLENLDAFIASGA